MVVTIKSSKTKKRREKPFVLPVNRSRDFRLCPVYWLERVRSALSPVPTAPLFPGVSGTPISYTGFSRIMSSLVQRAGLTGDFASHSLRRGGATMMAQNDCTLLDIKTRGQWSSDCVFQYLRPSFEHLRSRDKDLTDVVFN